MNHKSRNPALFLLPMALLFATPLLAQSPEEGVESVVQNADTAAVGSGNANYVVNQLTQLLTLTSAQQTTTTTFVNTLDTSVNSAQAAFTTGFEALLTPTQLMLYKRVEVPDLGALLGPLVTAADVTQTVNLLTRFLNLTASQQTQTTALLTQFQTAVSTAQSTFKTALEATLTPTQLPMYIAATATGRLPFFGTGADFVTNYVQYLNSLLTLTTPQQAQATVLVAKLQGTETTATAAFQSAFDAVLTASQLTRYKRSSNQVPYGLVDLVNTGATVDANTTTQTVNGLTRLLSLTVAQATMTTTVVNNLLSTLSSAEAAFITSLEAALTPFQLSIYKDRLMLVQR